MFRAMHSQLIWNIYYKFICTPRKPNFNISKAKTKNLEKFPKTCWWPQIFQLIHTSRLNPSAFKPIPDLSKAFKSPKNDEEPSLSAGRFIAQIQGTNLAKNATTTLLSITINSFTRQK